MGEFIVILVLAAAVFLAVRSMWKDRKVGKHCSGDCSGCHGCAHANKQQ